MNPDPLACALVILSLVTGEDWDEQKLIDTESSLKSVAVTTLVKQGTIVYDAIAIVDERFARYAETPVAPTEAGITGLAPSTPKAPTSSEIRERIRARVREQRGG